MRKLMTADDRVERHHRNRSSTAGRASQPFERRWATVGQTAELMSCSEQSIYRACRNGFMPCVKIKGVGLRIDLKRLNGQLGVSDPA